MPLANPYTVTTVRAAPPQSIRSYSPQPIYAAPPQLHQQTYNFMNEDSGVLYRPQTVVYAPVESKAHPGPPLALRQQAGTTYQPQFGTPQTYVSPAPRYYTYSSQ